MLKMLGHALAVTWRGIVVAFGWAETPLVRAFVRVAPTWAALRVALAALVLALVTLVLVGFLRLPSGGEGAPLKLALRPVYLAEQAQMRSEAPVFAQGLHADAARAWSKVPETGMFAVVRPDIRSSLARLLPTLDDVQGQWVANPTPSEAAAQLVSDLKKIDDRQKRRDGGADRVAIEYHLALAALYDGDQQDAEQRFQDVLKQVGARLGPLEDAQGSAAAAGPNADLARLYAVEIAADYGLGLAQLADPGRRGDAAATLRAAADAAGAHQDLVAAPADRLSAKLFTLDADQTLVRLDTADVYADLVAATIARAAQGDAKAGADLALLVTELQGKSMSGRPRLAANLEIAALLVGDESALGAFAPDSSADDPQLTQVANEVHAVASSDQAVADLQSYWGVVHAWRADLANGDATAIRRELTQSPAQFAAERTWLGEVLNDAYDDLKSPAERARFIQQYGDLLQGLSIVRSLQANMPLARYAGLPTWLATLVTIALALVAWLIVAHAVIVALRTREPWRVIYGSGYAADFRAHRPEPQS